MDDQNVPSLTAMFFDQAARHRERPLLWVKRAGAYQATTWQETARAVRTLSRGLRQLGLKPGDRVVLVSENRPEWLIADLAIMAAGAITVPAYTTNTLADHRHILDDSGAVGAIVSTPALATRLLPATAEAAACRWLIAIEDGGPMERDQVAVHGWHAVCETGRGMPDDVDAQVAQARPDDTACFIYTSGTGGQPKGVVLSHRNILCNCRGAFDLLADLGLGDEIFLSFLPLSHSYEHTAGQFFPLSIGAQIYYAEGAEHLMKNLEEVRPTIMTAVPRLYEAMHQRILRGVEKQGGLKKTLFDAAVRLGTKRYHDPRRLTLPERLLDALVERLVRDKVRGRFGGRLKAMVSGGAALNPEIGVFFTALGLRVLQGYGQTEAAPVVSANRPHKVKMHTVGPPLAGVEVKIADDGEILVRGDLVMKGYWRDEAATAAVLVDGWLHTGDIGRIDEDGYIQITDRKKDIIVVSGGDNVSPARIEGQLTLEPEIAQAMVYGDRHPYLVALLVPDEEFIKSWGGTNSARELADLALEEAFKSALVQAVERANQRLSSIERIRRVSIAVEPFTVENEMMTPTLKIRRHKIKAAYGAALEGLYARG